MQVQLTVASGKITDVSVLQYPSGNPQDDQINSYALPVLVQETLNAQSAQIDMVSGATVTSVGYIAVAAERARPGEPVTGGHPSRPAPTRYVEHVMGMPISLALRGRHAADAAGRDAWAEVMATLRDVDRVFSTYRARLVRVPARPRRGHPRRRPARGGARCSPWASAPRGSRTAPSPPGCRGRTAASTWTPAAWSRAGPSSAPRTGCARLADTDFALSAGGDMVVRTLDPAAPAWRVGVEDPHDPGRVLAVLPVHTGAVATSGTAHRGAHLVDARTGLVPRGVASVSVVASSLTWADIDATAAYALGPGAADWLRTRPGRTALVVWADGTTTSLAVPDRIGVRRCAASPPAARAC